MNDSEMKLGQFEDLLHTYGADFSRWPETEASLARQLIATSDAARQLLAESESLDRLFDKNKDLEAPEGLVDRIMKATKSS